MLKNHFILAFRNLKRKKGFTLINLLGLSLGMATALAIMLYVSFEMSYDDFHPKSENIYRVILNRSTEGKTQEVTNIPPVVTNELLSTEVIDNAVRFINIAYQNNSVIYTSGEGKQTIEVEEVYYADSTVADILELPMQSGGAANFSRPGKMLISASEATRLFGDRDPVGEVVSLSGNVGAYEYEIVGVFSDLPLNSDFDFKVLLSMMSLSRVEGPDVMTSWDYWQTLTYVVTENDPETVVRTMETIIESNEEIQWSASLTPLEEMHYKPYAISEPGNLTYVRALGFIGLIVLVIAWVNYINLSTSRAMERSKEVGVRKVLGSGKKQLAMQFIMESVVLNIIAAFIAFTLVQLLKPAMSQIANPMIVSTSQAPFFWGSVLLIILTGAVLSGSYPAFVMTSLAPSSILSGRFRKTVSGLFVRKGLIILQFSISVFLLIGTLTVYYQINYMRTSDLGMNISNHLVINSPPGSLAGDNTEFFEAVDAFRNEISKYAFVENITGSSTIPGESLSWGDSGIKRIGEESQLIRMVSLIAVDNDYFSVFDIPFMAGRNYGQGDNTFGRGEIIINEASVRHFGFESPEDAIGKHLEGGNMFPELTIIGVTGNYHHTSLRDDISPILYVLSSWSNYYVLRLNLPENPDKSLAQLNSSIDEIKGVWNEYFPDAPFDYFFADKAFDAQYRQDEKFGLLFGIFTTLAIFLAVLGLIGLVSYEVVQRSKEIGIRKVLGASLADLVTLLTRKYIILVMIAGLISLPAAYLIFRAWLEGFAFRIELSPALLIVSFGIVLFIAVIVSGLQVFRASGKNPVQSIKYE